MPATPIAPVTRYWPTGTSQWLWVPTMADYTNPTRAELDAGIALRREMNASEGWNTSGEDIETPDGESQFVGTIPGRITAEESSITFYADPTGSDARELMPRGAEGYIVRMPGGDVPGRKMDVFPVRVKTVSKLMNVGEDEAARLQIQFSITREPAEDIEIPA
ncbi:MAG: hypothetical protein IRZ07_04175 [Microbispora sp.]|nr:hypothetical protein [Microbispora sp.]